VALSLAAPHPNSENDPIMRSTLLSLLTLTVLGVQAQYGTFDKKAVTEAKSAALNVVLEDGDSPYNRVIMDAVRAHWKFNGTIDFIKTNDLATQPLDPTKVYMMRTVKSDAEKHDAVFLTLVKGWKQKKGEALTVENGGVKNIPPAQELAFMMFDQKAMAENSSPMLHVYVKSMQDYLRLVEAGKITDKATADRTYQSRNRLVKDMELLVAKEHCDKSLTDVAKIKETYTHDVKLVGLSQVTGAAAEGKSGVAISDVVMTGDYKTMWCFRRVFNASTGELMYARDEAALFGKKLGFISEDFRILEQSR
jgi:hypothetical protein